jgi:hypothetical protein
MAMRLLALSALCLAALAAYVAGDAPATSVDDFFYAGRFFFVCPA